MTLEYVNPIRKKPIHTNDLYIKIKNSCVIIGRVIDFVFSGRKKT